MSRGKNIESKKIFDEKSRLSRQFNQLNLELEKWREGVLRLKENIKKSNQEVERLKVLEKELILIQPQIKTFLSQKKQEEIFETTRIILPIMFVDILMQENTL